jgi:hypothetical protein
MQSQGLELACTYPLNEPEFYQGDVGFVSLNYDPICLWTQFIANRDLNKSNAAPHIGSPAVKLELFQDFGHLIPSRRIAKPEPNWPWFTMNEAATQRINEQRSSDSRVRLTKFLFPHGSLCWRECPDCRKLSSYHGDQWDLHSKSLFPPPPLWAFDKTPIPEWITGPERDERERGGVDARACLHCGTLTFAQHTQTVMQSSFKSPPPSFIEEIQRELRATTMHAKHIVFLGYSLPPDDVDYRSLFAATCQRGRGQSQQVSCTVVGKDESNPDWYGPADFKARTFSASNTIGAAVDIFGEEQVRFYGGGIPQVFLNNGRATKEKLEELLTWR